MKKEFSVSWVGSRIPRKQRKYLANAPFHLRKKLLSGHLSKELRQKYGKRSFPIRKGDNVKVMSGKNYGKTGKVSMVNNKKLRIAIEGLQITKKDGSKVNIWFKPFRLMINELNLEDKKRLASLHRKSAVKNEIKKQTKMEKE